MATTQNTTSKEGFISRSKPSSKAMDYPSLRKLGIDTIQKYGGKEWTDYNIHDPGVTILEILAFAITELGIKANSPVEDLLSSGKGEFIDLFKPAEIFPSLPVTTIDFRKLLVDRPGIQNAWISKHTTDLETRMYYDTEEKELTFELQDTKIKPSGFLDVLVEFEDISLNTNIISTSLTASTSNKYKIEFVYPYWDEVDSKDQLNLVIKTINLRTVPGTGGVSGKPERRLHDEGEGNYFAVLEVEYTNGFKDDFGVHIQVSPKIADSEDLKEIVEYTNASNPGRLVDLLSDNDSGSLTQQFVEKGNESRNTIRDLQAFINNCRNLCEEVYSIKTVRSQDIGISTDIDITVGADAEKVLSEIFFAVSQFISPLIQFKSYQEMRAKNYTVEEIFEGPLLKSGFLEAEDFSTGERINARTGEFIIYTSDLFNIIKSLNDSTLKDQDRIIDMRNFSLSNYINNQIVTENARNCLNLSLSQMYKPKLSILKSNIRIYKEGLEVEFDIDTVISKYNDLMSVELEGLKTTWPVDVLEIPVGEKMNVETFQTLHNDFPLTYGIGESGLADDVADNRKAKAKQLKAYLLLFEQMFRNFNAQLSHINEIFSFNTNTQRTYFYQLFSDVPLLEELVSANYHTALQDIVEKENSASQLERRNKFLNHLASRLGENTENAEVLFIDNYTALQKKMIRLKKKLLTDYPKLSSNRFKAFNYKQTHSEGTPDVWDTENVSGYERRVCHLLGFPDCRRRHLFNPVTSYFESYQEEDTDGVDEERFRLLDKEGNILLSSVKAYTDDTERLQEIRKVIQNGSTRENYSIITSVDKKLYFNLSDTKGTLIARRIEPFDTEKEIEPAIQEVIDLFDYAYTGEGFHAIEHILLRPCIRGVDETDSHRLLQTWYDNDRQVIYQDPYSFQMTVIVPSGYMRKFNSQESPLPEESPLIEIPGMERLRNKDFRRIMERTLRDESPAHILLHIITLDADSEALTGGTPSLNNFERVYKLWLETNANQNASDTQKLNTQRELLEVLQNIYNPVIP